MCSFTPKPTPETFFKSSFNTVEKCARGVRSNAYSSIREQEKLCTRLLFPHNHHEVDMHWLEENNNNKKRKQIVEEKGN